MNKFKQMVKDFCTDGLVLHTKSIVDSSIEIGYRSACDYPLVLGAGIVLLLVHRICPPLLAFLVSSSPLLLLTGLLLGALLSYGEPCTPTVIGQETSDNQQTVSVKSKISIADCSDEEVEKVTIHSEKRTSSAEFYVAERTTTNSTHDNHWEETNVTFLAANIALSTQSTQTNVIAGKEMCVEEISEKAELQEFQSRNTESGNYEVHNDYELGESMSPCWQSAAGREDPCYDSESDLTDESSSPDASMTDIIPMLEELHPLIDLGTGHPALASRGNLNSSSDDDEDDIEEEEDDISDDEDEEEEEEKDDGNNHEDDMGSSIRVDGMMELQRAKNILKFELDQRLMDLQTSDATEKFKEASRFYVQVPSIFTPRGKPFDPSNVSEEVIEIPKIPDSAPSVLLPSQNLFDDHDSQLQETWTPRSYSPATRLRKNGNIHGRHSTNPRQNGLKAEKGDTSGEDALRSLSVSDAAKLGKDGQLSQETHVGEEIKILSAESSGADVFRVDNGRHGDSKNADFSDDINSFPIMKNGSGTSEAKDSFHAGLSKPNNSEQYAVKENSIGEVNSLFRCRMEEVLVQSISDPIVGQPMTVKLEDESSDTALSSDSAMLAIEASSVEELNSQFSGINKESLACGACDSTCDDVTIQEKLGEAFPAAALGTEPVEDVGSTLEQ